MELSLHIDTAMSYGKNSRLASPNGGALRSAIFDGLRSGQEAAILVTGPSKNPLRNTRGRLPAGPQASRGQD